MFDEAADGSNLGHTGHGPELVLHIPVLQTAQLRQVALAAGVDQDVLQTPANPGGVRAELGGSALRQFACHAAQILQHAAARPVEIGAVLEDDVDEREAEEG